VKELAREVDGPSAEQRAEQGQTLVHASSSRARVDAAELDLPAVVAADADPEHQAAASILPERRELARDRHRMTKRKQVQPEVNVERVVEREERRGVHEAVPPVALVEAHVVAPVNVIEARIRECGEELAPLARRMRREVRRQERHSDRRTRGPLSDPVHGQPALSPSGV
jgi:hypothetical protein